MRVVKGLGSGEEGDWGFVYAGGYSDPGQFILYCLAPIVGVLFYREMYGLKT